jgi:hypothetical protein
MSLGHKAKRLKSPERVFNKKAKYYQIPSALFNQREKKR